MKMAGHSSVINCGFHTHPLFTKGIAHGKRDFADHKRPNRCPVDNTHAGHRSHASGCRCRSSLQSCDRDTDSVKAGHGRRCSGGRDSHKAGRPNRLLRSSSIRCFARLIESTIRWVAWDCCFISGAPFLSCRPFAFQGLSSRHPPFCSAQVGPIDIGPEVFAGHLAAGFALDGDCQFFATGLLVVRNVRQVLPGCLAPLGELIPLTN